LPHGTERSTRSIRIVNLISQQGYPSAPIDEAQQNETLAFHMDLDGVQGPIA